MFKMYFNRIVFLIITFNFLSLVCAQNPVHIDIKDDLEVGSKWTLDCDDGYANLVTDYTSTCNGGVDVPEEDRGSGQVGFWTSCSINLCTITYRVQPGDTSFSVRVYQRNVRTEISYDGTNWLFIEGEDSWIDAKYNLIRQQFISVRLSHYTAEYFAVLDRIAINAELPPIDPIETTTVESSTVESTTESVTNDPTTTLETTLATEESSTTEETTSTEESTTTEVTTSTEATTQTESTSTEETSPTYESTTTEVTTPITESTVVPTQESTTDTEPSTTSVSTSQETTITSESTMSSSQESSTDSDQSTTPIPTSTEDSTITSTTVESTSNTEPSTFSSTLTDETTMSSTEESTTKTGPTETTSLESTASSTQETTELIPSSTLFTTDATLTSERATDSQPPFTTEATTIDTSTETRSTIPPIIFPSPTPSDKDDYNFFTNAWAFSLYVVVGIAIISFTLLICVRCICFRNGGIVRPRKNTDLEKVSSRTDDDYFNGNPQQVGQPYYDVGDSSNYRNQFSNPQIDPANLFPRPVYRDWTPFKAFNRRRNYHDPYH